MKKIIIIYENCSLHYKTLSKLPEQFKLHGNKNSLCYDEESMKNAIQRNILHIPAALLSQAVIAIILVAFNSLNDLTNYVVFAGMLYNGLVILAVLLFVALMVNTLIEDPKTAIIGLVVPLVGVAIYFIFDARTAATPPSAGRNLTIRLPFATM